MNTIELLNDALRVGKKVRGHRVPVYRKDGSLDHYAKQLIEVVGGDVLEVCALADPQDPVVAALQKGCAGHGEGRNKKVILQADDLFHLIEKVSKPKASPVSKTPPMQATPEPTGQSVPAQPAKG